MAAPHVGLAGSARALLLASLPLLAGPAAANDATLPDWNQVRPVLVGSGLAGPVDFALAPDGSVWFVELYEGNVTRLDPRANRTEVKHRVEVVKQFDERGLVGLALDAAFRDNGAFYIFYTRPDPAEPDGGRNRLARVEGGQEHVLLDDMTAFKRHNGGRILVAHDGTLFVSTGDLERGTPAQDAGSPYGKVLHLTRDGQPAWGNVEGLVFTTGHRNIYGLAQHPTKGELYATENSVARRDEVNLLRAGANYGWPLCEGFHRAGNSTPCDDPRFTPPLMAFYDNRTAAPTGAAFLLGQLYWASWNEGSIHHLWWDDGTGEWRDRVVFDTDGRIADLEVGLDGRSLYYSTWNEVWRLEFPTMPPGVEKPHLPPGWQPPEGGALDAVTGGTGFLDGAPRAVPAAGAALAALALALAAARARRP